MIRNFLRTVLFAALLTAAARAEPYTAIRDGEVFRYRASWGIFGSAGEIIVGAKKDTYEGRPVFRVEMKTSTKGIIRSFYSYDETAVAIVDAETGRILVATDQADHGTKMSDAVTRFDYAKRMVSHRDPLRPGRNCDYALPAGDPIDLISALIQSREWADKVGLRRDALVFAGRDVYPIEITAERYEDVLMPKGRVKALVLVPRMVSEEPRGVFRRGGEIKVWVAQNGERLPVKMQLKLKVGTAQLTLMEHKVPDAKAAVEPAAARGTRLAKGE